MGFPIKERAMGRLPRKAELLRCLPELEDVSRKDLERIARLFDEVDYAKGSVLMREGDIGQQAFVIVHGAVEVSLRGRTLANLGPGEVVGEMALMDGEPRSATVVALEDTKTLVASRLDFAEFSEQPAGWRAVARAMSGRIRTVQPVSR
jgi:CRP-like cAMP-binding protein